MLEWTYNHHRKRAVIFDGPFIACEIICTPLYITNLLQHATLEEIVALKRAKLAPNELIHFFDQPIIRTATE